MNVISAETPCNSIQIDQFILAKNWDRLGGRVHEILNGYVLARILGREFRFIWPEEKRFPEMCDQIKIFAADFIKKHRIYESQLYGFQEIAIPSTDQMSINEYSSLIADLPKKHYLRPSFFFKIPEFKGFDSHSFFMNSVKEVFSEEFQDLDKKVRNRMQEAGISKVLHLRYGDILNGSFRQYPDISKYFPYCLACKMLTQNKGSGNIIIISDTHELSKHLSESDDSYFTPDDLLLYENCKDAFSILVIDLLILKNCSTVMAPSLSAFSQLGVHLGGTEAEIISVENQLGDITETLNWIDNNNIYKNLPEHLTGPLFARDFAQLMNTHSGLTDLCTWRKFASKAVMSDPDYVVGCAQMAVVYSFHGDFSNACRILDESIAFAYKAMNTHEDPLAYLTIVEIFCSAIQIVQEMNKGNLTRADSLLEQTLLLMQSLRSFNTFQIPLQAVIKIIEKSMLIFQSELLALKSKKYLELRINVLRQNPMIRRLFRTETKYLPPEEIFSSIYCKLNEEHFLLSLAITLEELAALFIKENQQTASCV